MKTIDIIVPCYNEEDCVESFYNEISNVFIKLENYDFSIIFINDGSHDRTIEIIKKLIKKIDDKHIKYISFARNFGKEAAIYVGLSKSSGDYAVVMDADLQHPPALLTEMIEALNEGYDCCAARRISRKGEPIIRSFFSRMFYYFINRITAIELHPGETDFRMMTHQVVEAIISLRERERFTKGIYSWIGFNTKWIEYKNVERTAGKSKWSFGSLLNYAGSGFIAFATTPLRGVAYLGMIIVILSFIYAIIVLRAAILNSGNRTGYASLLITILFLGGVIITLLGVIGEYLARIYMEVKQRPIYIVKESNIDEE